MSVRAPLTLAIDTTGADAGLALLGDGHLETARLGSRGDGRARTEDLAEETEALLARIGKKPGDLTLVAAVVGPGSYTGLRSGLAFLRGLALPDCLPAVAVGALELLAWQGAQPGETVVAAVPVAKDRCALALFCREFDSVRQLSEPQLVADEEYARALVGIAAVAVVLPRLEAAAGQAGSPSRATYEETSTLAAAARAAGFEVRVVGEDGLEQLVRLAEKRAASGGTVDAAQVLPIYVGQSASRPNRDRIAVPIANE